MVEIIPIRPHTAGWTTAEHDALTLLAIKLFAAIEFGTTDDGAPWVAFETARGKFSVIREGGRVAVLDEQGRRSADAGTVQQVVLHLWGRR